MPGPESDRESTFAGSRGRVIRTAAIPLAGIAIFGVVGPLARFWERPGYGSVPSEFFFTLPSIFDALLLCVGCIALTLVARAEERQRADLPVAHRRALRGAPTALFVVFAVAQMFGLLQVVDRTPRDFPWQLYLALSMVVLSAGVALTRRGLRLANWRCFTSQLAGHAVLMAPGLLWLALDALQHDVSKYYPGLCAGLCWLSLIGLVWAGRRGSRWLDSLAVAVCALTLLVAAPVFLSARITRSYMMDSGERCHVALEFAPIWSAGPGRDPVCQPGALGWLSWGETALLSLAGSAGLVWWLRRRRESWTATN